MPPEWNGETRIFVPHRDQARFLSADAPINLNFSTGVVRERLAGGLSGTRQCEAKRFIEVQLPAGTTGEDGEDRVDQNRLQEVIENTAYEFYRRGSGDVLGPATVRREGAHDVISYEWLPVYPYNATGPVFIRNYSAGNETNITLNSSGLWTDDNATWTGDWNAVWTNANPNVQITFGDITPQPALSPERLEIVNRKAKELLLQHLSEPQRKTWLAHRYFEVFTPSGRRYRIEDRRTHNVFLLGTNNQKVREYCAYAADPGGQLPLEDCLFAQLITLTFNEDAFLKKANTWDLLRNKLFVGQGVDAHKPAEIAEALAA